MPSISRLVLTGLLNHCANASDDRSYEGSSSQTQLHDLATQSARGLLSISLPSNKRAQGKPGARCTRGLVRKYVQKKRTRAYRFSGGNPAFPARWVTAYFVLSSVSRALLPPSSLRSLLLKNFAPASGARTTRLRRPRRLRSSVASCASTASRSAFVTLRNAPLSGTGPNRYIADLP